jgi:hypothetical protein
LQTAFEPVRYVGEQSDEHREDETCVCMEMFVAPTVGSDHPFLPSSRMYKIDDNRWASQINVTLDLVRAMFVEA